MRVLITGGRTFATLLKERETPEDLQRDSERVARERQIIHGALSHVPGTAVLVHGAAPGADTVCAEIWESFGGKTEAHAANWKAHGPGAGPRRNQAMVDLGADLLLAFPGGTGTADCKQRALKAGIPVVDAATGERIDGGS
jgi:hypothetical protein